MTPIVSKLNGAHIILLNGTFGKFSVSGSKSGIPSSRFGGIKSLVNLRLSPAILYTCRNSWVPLPPVIFIVFNWLSSLTKSGSIYQVDRLTFRCSPGSTSRHCTIPRHCREPCLVFIYVCHLEWPGARGQDSLSSKVFHHVARRGYQPSHAFKRHCQLIWPISKHALYCHSYEQIVSKVWEFYDYKVSIISSLLLKAPFELKKIWYLGIGSRIFRKFWNN